MERDVGEPRALTRSVIVWICNTQTHVTGFFDEAFLRAVLPPSEVETRSHTP